MSIIEENSKRTVITEHSYSVLSGNICPNNKTANGWGEFDHIICTFLKEQNVPGASVAISKNGTILYQQGYGIAGASRRVHQDSMFRIASISKPITAATVMQLCDSMKVSLNTKVFGKAGILKSYKTKDKRMKNITIRHLLQHSAGWDRDKVGDAVFVRPQCVMKEHPDSQAYNSALLTYALMRKLQFSPGKWHSYSNLGYLILGEVIEALSGQSYKEVIKAFLQDHRIHNVIVGKRTRASWTGREVEYFNNREPQVVSSIYPGESEVLPQYGGMAMESSGSYGGLVCDTVSLLKFVHCMEQALAEPQAETDTGTSNSKLSKEAYSSAESEHQKTNDIKRGDYSFHLAQSFKVYDDEGSCRSCVNIVNSLSDIGRFNGSTTDIDTTGTDSRTMEISTINKCFNTLATDNCAHCPLGNLHDWSLTPNYLTTEISIARLQSVKKLTQEDQSGFVLTSNSDQAKPLNTHQLSTDLQAKCCKLTNKEDSYKSYASDRENSVYHLQTTGSKLVIKEAPDISCVSNSTCSHSLEYLNGYDNNKCGNSIKSLSDTPQTDKLTTPLLTATLAKESLSRPGYENGNDWYGLGWDVQDNSKSWGHTGGMEGSCGTLFHHESGLNWVFLLNSWAMDCDLNGVIKCALCSVPGLTMYNKNVLSFDNEQGVRIVTLDKSQIIYLCVSKSAILKIISELKTKSFMLKWISNMNQDISNIASSLLQGDSKRELLQDRFTDTEKTKRKYFTIFQKSQVQEYFILFNKTVTELKSAIDEHKKDNFVIYFLDSFVDSQFHLRFTAAFKQVDPVICGDTVVLLAVKAADYIKCVKKYVECHYVIVVQSVTEVCDELYVSAVLSISMLCIQSLPQEDMSYKIPNFFQDITDNHLSKNFESTENPMDMIPSGTNNFDMRHSNSNKNCEKFNTKKPENTRRPNNIKNNFQEKVSCHGIYMTNKPNEQIIDGNPGNNVTNSLIKSEKDCSFGQDILRNSKINSSKKKSILNLKTISCIYWVQISPESFLTELNRQIKRRSSLLYAKFYTVDKKPFVSGCWLPQRGGNCYHRIAMSKYGVVPELVEAASKNIHLQSLSEYTEEDGMQYYAAIWHAS